MKIAHFLVVNGQMAVNIEADYGNMHQDREAKFMILQAINTAIVQSPAAEINISYSRKVKEA